MKTVFIGIVFFCARFFVSAQELQRDMIRNEFFETIRALKIPAEYFASLPQEEGTPFSNGIILGDETFNLVYYPYNDINNDFSIYPCIEIYKQSFFISGNGLMQYGNFFLFRLQYE